MNFLTMSVLVCVRLSPDLQHLNSQQVGAPGRESASAAASGSVSGSGAASAAGPDRVLLLLLFLFLLLLSLSVLTSCAPRRARDGQVMVRSGDSRRVLPPCENEIVRKLEIT